MKEADVDPVTSRTRHASEMKVDQPGMESWQCGFKAYFNNPGPVFVNNFLFQLFLH